MRKISGTVLILMIPILLYGQGFNSANGRNHPELKWMVAETPHFVIMYPRHLEGIEHEAAAIAEETYEVLSENLEVSFNKKIRIYLSDEDEIANGFAVPLKYAYTDIWVNVNEYAEVFTGREKWLRKVIAHELAHIFHFEAVRGNSGFLALLFGNPLPRFWTEGLAQYQTEEWDAQRGDRWLRLAVFDDKMNYLENSTPINRRLQYAVGNSQLRYFAETYGDSSLTELLQYRDRFLAFKYHDFEPAFNSVIGKSYADFYDEWRKHVNIYYNTLAAGMGREDSLEGEKVNSPGQFLYDVKFSPDQSRFATISLTSLKRPVRRLYVTQNDSTHETEILSEGPIQPGLDWSPEGTKLAYAKKTREKHGSLINDIFIYDLGQRKERQITQNRRARFPVFSNTGDTLAYIAEKSGTANIYLRRLAGGEEQRVTSYTGDTQLLNLAWNGQRNSLIYHLFDDEGNRHLVLLKLETGEKQILDIDEAEVDNRMPVISATGRYIAFTSLRDNVPNVFVHDLNSGTTRRFTNQFAGAEAYQWLGKTEEHPHERIILKASEDKDREHLYSVSEDYSFITSAQTIPEKYSSWIEKSPPKIIPSVVEPDSSLVNKRYNYRSLSNLSHVASFALPYYGLNDSYGLFGTTAWTEPLGKHSLIAGGNLSFTDVEKDSYGVLTYINNQLYPSLIFSAYKVPGSGRFYGDDYLFEELTGGEVQINWPIDWFDVPYRNDLIGIRLRHVLIRPLDAIDFPGNTIVPQSEKARQTDLKLTWITKKQRPYYNNLIHPLDGYGIKLSVMGAEKVLGSETSFLTSDLSAYKILSGFGLQRFYLYGRYQVQFGNPLPQDFIGFTRYSNISWPIDDRNLVFPHSKAERVRGYRSFVSGRQVAFGTIEYRMPVTPSLQTSILGGFLELGSTSLAVFMDGGVVWDVQIPVGKDSEQRLGTGVEIKNEIGLGPLKFVHSLGIAQPVGDLFADGDYDLYYQIKASVPF
ncbi:BamA/TamA family outer membrane protein [Balneolaceae bacterium YR4-1]|uniref:BamA/TamA family outer membrane protein n=1 Tax=Halalkalibaculum roseum TaxID=2709311 RepID=A0A6M1T128_9BACT|nr:DPP IV N-terminal domain-containing protein [Halalkalibaculum roseum]NGP77264.1 BamA/TamA family outer membrane protein [Halalkalibaculum roseum]